MKTPQAILAMLVVFTTAGCATNVARGNLERRDLSLAPTLLPVPKAASGSLSGQNGAQAAQGAAAMNDAILGYPGLAEAVRKNGRPDALEVHQNQAAFFYRNPARTIAFERASAFADFHESMELNVVPRSVRRLGFGEPPTTPPWPVTLSQPQAEALGAPTAPQPPKSGCAKDCAAKYHEQSETLRKKLLEVQSGESYDRASRAFARLNPASSAPGIDWRVVVVASQSNLALGVPDGTIFLSDGLASSLSDNQLAAVIAHLMGHVAYGDDRIWWTEASLAAKTAVVVGVTVLVVAALAAGYRGGGGGSPPDFIGYSEQQEVDADYSAAQVLAAADIPPDALFDAMAQLGASSCAQQEASGSAEMREFNTFHHAGRSAADFGKMLDAGTIQMSRRSTVTATIQH